MYDYHGQSPVLQLYSFFLPWKTSFLVYHQPTWKDPGLILSSWKSIIIALSYQVFLKSLYIEENYRLNYSKRQDGMIRAARIYFTVILKHRSSSKTFKHCQSLQCSAPKQNCALWKLQDEDPSLVQYRVYLYGLSGHYALIASNTDVPTSWLVLISAYSHFLLQMLDAEKS